MKMKLASSVGAAFMAFSLAPAANAASINGFIDFGLGNVTLLDSGGSPTPNFSDVRGLAFSGTTVVNNSGGDLTTPFLTPVTFNQNPWTFEPVSQGSLWTVGSFTFHVLSTTFETDLVTTSNGFTDMLEVIGTGFVSSSLPQFDNTPGNWILTTQRSSTGGVASTRTTLSWSSSASAAAAENVPDGGTTMALLGVTLLGLHGARRKFSKR